MPLDLLRASLEDISNALIEGKTTSVELVQAYIGRIQKNDQNGLRLKSMIEVAPTEKLLKAAKKLDDERKTGRIRSALHGVPIAVKDAFCTSTELGMETTSGMLALVGKPPANDADVFKSLLAGGAIILGKTNCSVLGYGLGNGYESGWSPRGGQTRSAYGPNLFVGGSSTGSAVAVAAGFCAAAIGTESYGSSLGPARCSALYCLRPGQGLVPAGGTMCDSTKTILICPMAKTVGDLAILLSNMAIPQQDYTMSLHVTPTPRYRFGVVDRTQVPADTFYTYEPGPSLRHEVIAAYEGLILSLGDDVVNNDFEIHGIDYLSHAKSGPSRWDGDEECLRGHSIECRSLYYMYDTLLYGLQTREGNELDTPEKLLGWFETHRDQSYPPHLIDHPDRHALLSLAIQAGQLDAYRRRSLISEIDIKLENIGRRILLNMDNTGLDVVLFPSGLEFGSIATAVASCGGYPLGFVPVGTLSSGDHHGVYIRGRKGGEGRVLQVMAYLESKGASLNDLFRRA